MNFVYGGFPPAPILRCDYHTHSNWEIIYQCTEHTCATAGGVQFPLMAGDLIVIPPDTEHRTESDRAFVDMHIRLKTCDFPLSPFAVRDTDGSIRRVFEMIRAADAEMGAHSRLLCDKLSELVCLYIKKAIDDRSCPEFILRFKAVLAENVSNPDFDLGRSIESTGYNPDYFRRVFKGHTGLSPLAYLNRLRIDRARELLRMERYLSIEEVAGRCGFRDSFYFSTAFKKQEGIPPREFRNRADTEQAE